MAAASHATCWTRFRLAEALLLTCQQQGVALWRLGPTATPALSGEVPEAQVNLQFGPLAGERQQVQGQNCALHLWSWVRVASRGPGALDFLATHTPCEVPPPEHACGMGTWHAEPLRVDPRP